VIIILRSIYEDRTGILWVGTNNGLDRFNKETEPLLITFVKMIIRIPLVVMVSVQYMKIVMESFG
jgi:ligand-binding sensor domain-containing protein